MCNDNLSGIAVSTYLADYKKKKKKRKFSYRFLFIPGTIGSITWLALNSNNIKNIAFGLVLTGVGDRGNITYKKSKKGNSEIDFAFEHILSSTKTLHKIIEFYPFGYDERQYSSPGFNLSFGTLMRSRHGTYPEYHTSDDNLDFVTEKSLAESLKVCTNVVDLLEQSRFYVNQFPYGEPQLGKRGIYKAMNDVSDKTKDLQMAILWILNYSDGYTSLNNIARKSGLDSKILSQAAEILIKNNVIRLR